MEDEHLRKYAISGGSAIEVEVEEEVRTRKEAFLSPHPWPPPPPTRRSYGGGDQAGEGKGVRSAGWAGTLREFFLFLTLFVN